MVEIEQFQSWKRNMTFVDHIQNTDFSIAENDEDGYDLVYLLYLDCR